MTMANATQLEAALLNLVINARDAVAGRGAIEVHTRVVQMHGDAELEDGRYVELCVSDTGPGMPPEIAARAFEPFFTTKPESKGTGLGLSQVKGVAIRAGGTARIRSQIGKGMAVSLFLKALTPQAQSSASGDAPNAPYATTGHCRILLIDDDAHVRDALAELLRDAHYGVEAVAGGLAALQAIDRTVPDAVVTDQAMQGVSGVLLARVLSETHPRLPVIFMTGYNDADTLKAGLPTGTALLRKPVLFADLAQAVQAAIESASVVSR